MMIDNIVQLSNKAFAYVPSLLKAEGRGAIFFFFLNYQACVSSSSVIL